MPAASQLERINQLAERLAPLAGKTRGMKVEADEWNALVETLRATLDVARAQEGSLATTLEEKYAPREHQHLGEVSVEWLDADLQSRLEGGGASIELRTAFIELGKKFEALSAEVARLNAVVERQQRKLDESAVKEADRAKVLRSFEERFVAVETLRPQFTAMSGQFQGLSQNVAAVLELRKRLTDAGGNPIDLNDLSRRLRVLERSEDVPTRFRDFDIRIRDLEDVTATGAGSGLSGRLNSLTADVETRFNSKLDERIEATRVKLAQEQEERAERLRASVNAGLENVKGETARLLDTQLRASQSIIATQLDERLRATGEQLRRDVTTSATAHVEARFGELDVAGKIRAQTDAARGEIEARLETNLRAQLTENLKGVVTTSVAGVEQRLAARVAAAEGLVSRTTQELPARVKAEVTAASEAITTSLDRRVGERLTDVQKQLEPVINTRVEAAVTRTAERLTAQVETTVQQRVGNLDARVSSAVSAELKTLPVVVSGAVETRIAALKLDDRLTQMRSALETNLSAQLSQPVAELRAKVTTSEAAVNELRGQVVSSQRAAAEAQTRAVALEAKLAETNRSVDTRFSALTRTTDRAVLTDTTRIDRIR